MSMMRIVVIMGVLSFGLAACAKWHARYEARQEAACWPGTRCYQQAHVDEQAARRQQYIAARQQQLRQGS